MDTGTINFLIGFFLITVALVLGITFWGLQKNGDSPILRKSFNAIIILVGLVILYFILSFIWSYIPWSKLGDYLPNTPDFPDFSFNLDNSFFTTWDWATFPLVQTYFAGYGNILIWAMVGLAIFWTISSLIQRKIEWGFSGTAFVSLLVVAFIIAMVNSGDKEIKAKVAKSSFVDVRKFTRAVDGLELVVDMGVTQIAQIGLHMTNSRIHGNGKAFWACTMVIKPQVFADSLNFEVTPNTRGQYTNHIRLTEESRDMLIENGIMDIQVKFTQTLGTPTQSPCKHLK